MSILGFFKKKRENLAWLIFIAYTIFFFPIFWVESRYLLPILPVLILFAAESTSFLDKFFNKKLLTYGFIILVIVLALSGFFVNKLLEGRFEKTSPPIEHKEAGLWLKEYQSNSIIMSRKPYVPFYSNGFYVNLPFAPLSDVLEFACNKKVDFIVADKRYSSLRPNLLEDLEKSKLKEVYSLQDLKIYELDCKN